MGDVERIVDRSRVREHLSKNPGQRPSDVAQAFGVHPSTADYHLRRLEAEGAIVRVQVGRELHHYPAGSGWCQESRRIHARLTPAGRAMVRILLDRGMVSRRAVVSRGYSRSATRWALEQLKDVGLVQRAGWGIYEPDDERMSCAVAALREQPCRSCNEIETDQVARPTRSPSPRGRIVASRLE